MTQYIYCACITDYGWLNNRHSYVDGVFTSQEVNAYKLLTDIKKHVQRMHKHYANSNIEIISLTKI